MDALSGHECGNKSELVNSYATKTKKTGKFYRFTKNTKLDWNIHYLYSSYKTIKRNTNHCNHHQRIRTLKSSSQDAFAVVLSFVFFSNF